MATVDPSRPDTLPSGINLIPHADLSEFADAVPIGAVYLVREPVTLDEAAATGRRLGLVARRWGQRTWLLRPATGPAPVVRDRTTAPRGAVSTAPRAPADYPHVPGTPTGYDHRESGWQRLNRWWLRAWGR